MTRILEHLYKLSWSRRDEPKGGWRGEIVLFRANLRRTLTPAIRARLEAELETMHRDAGRAAALSFETYEPEAPRDESLRWRLEQVLGEADDPVG